MLTELHIQDFAIIDQLALKFSAGLIIFTGETGAGKSIIIDAMSTLLGSRADATMIRSGAEYALVEGTFHLSKPVRGPVQAILEREGLLEDPEYLTLAREIREHGRSIARVNGRTVNLRILRDLGEYLVDVHGQSEHLSLLRVRHHLELLDRFAGNDLLLAAYQKTYHRLQAVRGDLNDLRQSEREAARRSDLLAYQIEEIESARLTPDEEEGLQQERNRLANAENLVSLSQAALQALDESDPETQSVTDLFGQASSALGSLARTDPSQVTLGEQAAAISESLSELARALRDYLEGVEFNPKRLSVVEDRLDLIYNLKRKYGDSIPEVLEFLGQARQQLEDITNAEERIAVLEKEERQLLETLATEGMVLSENRRAAAKELSEGIVSELENLRMDQAQFEVDLQTRLTPDGVPLSSGERVAFDARGLDLVEFLVAPNPGEGLKPLVKIASGGETSRLMLALKNVLARADQTPTLIFDEIDQGIGGRVGTIVGQKLWSLARGHQVMCITHLPQLAAYGGRHFRVIKAVKGGRTRTEVEVLSGKKRVDELALMMGEISAGTRQSAQDILRMVEETTSTKV
jgi:DNA repair protein RecN (Recombination protein N)